jgi:hypothetical protein
MEYKSISTSYNENLSPGEYVRRYQYISDRANVLYTKWWYNKAYKGLYGYDPLTHDEERELESLTSEIRCYRAKLWNDVYEATKSPIVKEFVDWIRGGG